MKNFTKIFAICCVAVLLTAAPVSAQQQGSNALITFSGAIGAGLVTLGAAFGIGKIAGSAVESMARQPEVAGQIQTAMLIAAALIEGFTFFAIFVCMQQNPWGS